MSESYIWLDQSLSSTLETERHDSKPLLGTRHWDILDCKIYHFLLETILLHVL
jgi:hypothetical protein